MTDDTLDISPTNVFTSTQKLDFHCLLYPISS